VTSLATTQRGKIELEKVVPVSRHGKLVKYVTSITAGRLHELLESERIWVDYDYQRGVKITQGKDGSEKRVPMVDSARVDDMTRKILDGELYGGALTWNLRKDEVMASYDEATQRLSIEGRPTIPDSNHRHQAAKKAVELARIRDLSFDADGYEFPLVIEDLDMDGEAGLFYEYNQLGKPANPTRSRFINQAPLHNQLASRVMEGSVLAGNVELVTNNLTRNTNKVMTFNTLSKGIELGFKTLDESNFEEVRSFLIQFVNCLAEVRKEVGYLSISDRLKIRESSIGDSGLVFQAYFRLAGELRGYSDWRERLLSLGEPYIHHGEGEVEYKIEDVMSRDNKIWRGTVLTENANGKISIANSRNSQEFVYHQLRKVVGLEK
jgi:hypothetical protein